jgi:hypothetical protein
MVKTKFFAITRSVHIQAMLALSVAALLLYRIYYAPKLVSDDWMQIVKNNVFGPMPWYVWPSPRPLHLTPIVAIYRLFGLNIHLLHAINGLLLILVLFMIYFLLDRLLPDQYPFALAVALLSLLYPADFTLSWLTMISLRLAWLVGLVGMWLLLDYALGGRALWVVLASLCLFISLWIYEGALGFEIAYILLLFVVFRHLPLPKRLMLVSPMLLLILYVWFRLYYLPTMGVIGNNLMMFNRLAPEEFFRRLVNIQILLDAWSTPFPIWLRGSPLASLPNDVYLLGILLAVGLLALIGSFVIRSRTNNLDPQMTGSERRRTAKLYGWVSIAALGFILAGYFPIILVHSPNLEEKLTRTNMFAIPAASALIVALLSLAVLGIMHSRRQWQVLLSVTLLPLMLIGFGVQLNVQKLGLEAWTKQRSIWSELFEIAPDFTDGTTVVFILKGRDEMVYGHLPIYASWEADAGIKVLYQNNSLRGQIYSPEMDLYSEATIKPLGIIRFGEKDVRPYDQIVFLTYNIRSGKLRLLDTVPDHPEYDPWRRIIQTTDKIWRYRYLVGGG